MFLSATIATDERGVGGSLANIVEIADYVLSLADYKERLPMCVGSDYENRHGPQRLMWWSGPA